MTVGNVFGGRTLASKEACESMRYRVRLLIHLGDASQERIAKESGVSVQTVRSLIRGNILTEVSIKIIETVVRGIEKKQKSKLFRGKRRW